MELTTKQVYTPSVINNEITGPPNSIFQFVRMQLVRFSSRQTLRLSDFQVIVKYNCIQKYPEWLREKDDTAVLLLLDLAGALPWPQIEEW